MGLRCDLSEVIVTELKFLAFRSVRPDMKRLRWHYLMFGLVSSWLVGVGRYWDAPDAPWWQQAGLGSLVYTVFMSAFLWAVVMAMQPENWTYFHVLTFVGMTAPPGLLYAIPVEKLLQADSAHAVNQWFLLVVALWRVVLLWFYLRRAGRLARVPAFLALAFPLSAVMAFLTLQQLQASVMSEMSGNRRHEEQVRPDIGQWIVGHVGLASIVLCPIVFIGYVITATRIDSRKSRDAWRVAQSSAAPEVPKVSGRDTPPQDPPCT